MCKIRFLAVLVVANVLFVGAAQAQAIYQVSSTPTFVITTGRAEVLGAVRITAFNSGPTVAGSINFLYQGIGCDNDTTNGVSLSLGPPFTPSSVAVTSVENLSAGCVVSVNVSGGVTLTPGDSFIEVQGVRGRVDLSPAATPGENITVFLNGTPSASSLFTVPASALVARSAAGITVSVQNGVQLACAAPSPSPTPRVRIAEAFNGAFVQYVTSLSGTPPPSDARRALGALNNTQVRILVANLPAGVTFTWPAAATGTSVGSLQRRSAATDTEQVYEFVTASQATSDINAEQFNITPSVTLSGTPAAGTATVQVQLFPGLISGDANSVTSNPFGSGTGAAKPRFNDPLTPAPAAALLTISPCNPLPTLTSLSPSGATAGGTGFALSVNGTGFILGSVVRWNGGDRPTTFISSSQLQASVSTGDIAAAGTAQVTVFNPSPGGGLSNALTFTISSCTFSISPTSQSFPARGGNGSVGVTAASNCSWTAASNAPWITITSASTGAGNGRVDYSVARSNNTSPRTGTLTIAGQVLTVTQAAAAALSVLPAVLTFAGQRGGANPPAQSVQVTLSDSSAVPWTAAASTTSGGNWLSISPVSGTTPGSISVSANMAGLAAGTYSGQVALSSAEAVPATVSVTLNVSEAQPTVGVSPASLQFATPVGTNPALQSLTISNLGGGTLSWVATISYTTGSGWLSISPPGGNAPTTASVSVDIITPRLTAGTYRGQIVISALSGATNSPLSLPVTLAVTSPAQLAVSPQFLSFQVTQGSSTPASQALSIANAGSGTLNWTAAATTSTGGNWLALSAQQGIAPATLVISVNPAGLPAGVYQGLVTISDLASNQVAPVTVALTVNAAAGTILLSQSDFVFTTRENAAPQEQSLRILNIGQGTLDWKLLVTTPSGGSWLTVDQGSGSTTTDPSSAPPVSVVVNPAGLPSGNQNGLLIVSASGASNSPQLATAHLRVVPPTSSPFASVLPSGFIFTAAERASNPPAQRFAVQNVGGGTLSFTVGVSTTDGVAWLAASPAQATAPATISVQVSSGSLKAGVYRGKIELAFPGGATQDLSVLLVITPAAVGASAFAGLDPRFAACTPTQLHAVSTVLPNNFAALVGWPVPILVRVVDNCANPIPNATVVASFAGGGDAPLLLRSLRDGLYSGTWVPLSSQRVRMTIKVLNPPFQEATVELNGQVGAFTAGLPVIRGAVNGASFTKNVPVAPGSIISLFGQNLAAQPLQASAPLPRSLGGLAVKIGDIEAPLFYVGPDQVNVQVPFELAASTAASMVVIVAGKVSPPEALLIAPAQPGVFTYQLEDKVMRGAVLDERNRTVGPANPAAGGTVIQIFATGLGPVDPPVKTGEPGPSVAPAKVTSTVEVTVGGVPAALQFAGLAPGFTGLYQVNAVVPSGLRGDVPLVLLVNGIKSNEVMLAVQ